MVTGSTLACRLGLPLSLSLALGTDGIAATLQGRGVGGPALFLGVILFPERKAICMGSTGYARYHKKYGQTEQACKYSHIAS